MDSEHHLDRVVIDLEVDSGPGVIDADNLAFIESNSADGDVTNMDIAPEISPGLDTKELDIPEVSVEQAARRKCRAKLRRMLRPGAKPSFLALISPDERSNSDSEVEVRIDVDEYLGLKPTISHPASDGEDKKPAAVDSTRPSDEGWYEGVVPLSLPGEKQYLNELHRFIRSHLELFSATQQDIAVSLPGRRTPTVLGKVGMRCIHCARAAKESNLKPDFKTWPAGSVSYPINIAGIYPVCASKPSLHFEKCPRFPMECKADLYRLTHDENGTTKRQRKVGPGDSRGAVGTGMYYSIAAKQLGLVDVKGGIRFGRDLTLEPLHMETVRAQIEHNQTTYRRPWVQSPERPDAIISTEPRITADEASERVLAAAVAEKDDEDQLVALSSDNNLVTDFMFLCVRQMALCYADEADFETRGKKTKSMRVGFAGFCCRHCAVDANSDNPKYRTTNFTCRSFSSAPDNLASAISNSFYAHLDKCSNVPLELKRAMGTYKKLHHRQMRQLPYGAQRRLFHLLWSRLRARDLTAEEMTERRKNAPPIPPVDKHMDGDGEGAAGVPSRFAGPKPDIVSSFEEDLSNWTRPANFPVTSDEMTRKVLLQAETDEETKSGDSLLLPSDRPLISDFVFLMMKQVKVAHPTVLDFVHGKRSTVLSTSQPGLRCKYCMHEDPRFTTKGRSFPSQPDNIASTLNSSMYQHMQKCQLVPDELKRALTNLKKIHSTQISRLRFGAQRRFFNILFDRLTALKIEGDEDDSDGARGTGVDNALERNGFICTVGECFECQHCRMVPYALRAGDSFSLTRPSIDFTSGHRERCAKSSFNLSSVAEALSHAVLLFPEIIQDHVMSKSFEDVVKEAVGGDEQLCKIFTTHTVQFLGKKDDVEATRRLVIDVKAKSKGLWAQFPSSVDTDRVLKALEAFSSTSTSPTSNLLEKKPLVRFLQLISPALVIDETSPDERTERRGKDD